jgi:molecular chaperone GrpE (heat shock protein)
MEELASSQEAVPDAFPSNSSEEPEAAGSREETASTGALTRLEAAVTDALAEVLREIREKAAVDRFREEQIDRLHTELQTYKNDLVSKQARLLIQGIVRLHDDLGRSLTTLRQKPPAELTPEMLFRELADFQDDLELLLGQHGVERFEAPGEEFDPRRQTVARTVSTDDAGQVGRIAERVRPGFEQGETILQKERVAVYVASSGTNDKAQGGHS